MCKRKDISGQRFGRLLALNHLGSSNSNGEALWEFLCDCGQLIITSGTSVRRGHTQSCGCLHKDNHFKHGLSDTASYRTERTRQWRESHPEKAHAFSGRSQKSRGLRTPKWLTAKHLQEMSEVYKLANEKTRTTGVPHEVDHIYPLQGKLSSGLHVPWNLQVITKGKNRLKSNNHPTIEDIVRTEWQHSDMPDKEQA